jgi:hypothetical protein
MLGRRNYAGAATDIGSTTGSSEGTVLTSGSANAKGSYSQLVASTSLATMFAQINWKVSADMGTLSGKVQAIDLAVGASGHEQVVLSNLVIHDGAATPSQGMTVGIPLSIPAGSRVAARSQSSSASDLCAINVILFGGSLEFPTFEQIDTYGFNTGTTLGTSVDPGGTANTKGSYTQITSSTNRDHFGLIIGVDDLNTSPGVADILLDIAVGASGSEKILISNYLLTSSGVTDCFSPQNSGVIPVQVPSGTRLSARAASTNTTSGTRKMGITLYGLS